MSASTRSTPPTVFEEQSSVAARLRRRLAWLPQPRARPARPSVSPAVVEEEAANLLYGERTGMVNASPSVPPLGEGEQPAGAR